jgi:hypothetical protein
MKCLQNLYSLNWKIMELAKTMRNSAVCKLRLTIVDAHALGEPRKGGQRQRQQGVHRAVRSDKSVPGDQLFVARPARGN